MNDRTRPWAVRRLFRFPFRSRADVRADVAEEFQFHIDMRTDELMREGVPECEAREQANREFGNRDAGLRACADTGDTIERRRRVAMWRDEVRQDVTSGLRLLRKSPGFAAVAILTLALGIGANTAIFSVLDTLLIRPLPYPNSERLVQISETVETGQPNSVSGGAFLDWQEHQTQFEAIALTNPVAFNVRASTAPDRITGLEVSSEFFRVLGVPVRLGRGFLPGSDRPGGATDEVVITEELWQTRFGADPAIVGRTMLLDDVPHTVVGVFPARSWVIRDHKLFVPAVLTPGSQRAERSPHWAAVFARLAPGATTAQADAELKALKQRLTPLYPSFKQNWSVVVQPAADMIRGLTRGPLFVLLTAVSVLLLIACANVANLLIARGCDRQQELAVRTALGATGARVVRQVITENIVLAGLGGLAGIAVAYGGTALLRQLTTMAMPLSQTPHLDARALVFSAVVTIATGLAAGALPALRARRVNLNAAISDGGRGKTAAGRQRTQSALVIAEVALTVVLLGSAGLLLRSLANTASVDPGFEPARTLAFDLSLPEATYTSREKHLAFVTALLDRLRTLPGVSTAGSGMTIPFSGGGYGERFRLPDADQQDFVLGRLSFATSGFLESLGVRLLEGRLLTSGDNRMDGPRVVVINDTAARTVFAGQQAVGRPLRIAGDVWQVIGVIGDVVDRQLDSPPQPFAYAPLAFNTSQISIALRTPLDPLSLVGMVRGEVERLDPGVAVANPRALDAAMDDSMLQRKVVLGLVAAFAAAALVLASIGLYGVLAYAVVTRRREIGIRIALGARRGEIIRLVLGSGLAMTGAGLVIGVIALAGAGRLLSSQLYEVGSSDPLALAATAMSVAVVALLATAIPAMRAAALDPTAVLRSE